MIDEKIAQQGIDAVMAHVAIRQPDGQWQLQPQVSDADLRAALTEAKAQADKAGIPEVPENVDPSGRDQEDHRRSDASKASKPPPGTGSFWSLPQNVPVPFSVGDTGKRIRTGAGLIQNGSAPSPSRGGLGRGVRGSSPSFVNHGWHRLSAAWVPILRYFIHAECRSRDTLADEIICIQAQRAGSSSPGV